MNTTIRLLPANTYDIGAIEGWLGSMSEKGLYLKGAFGIFLSFKKMQGAPVCRYRLEPQLKDFPEPTDSMAELFAEMGWKYICSIGNIFYVFACDDPGISDTHTDFSVQAECMKRIVRNTVIAFFINLIFMAGYITLFVISIFKEGTPLITFASSRSISAIILIICVILDVVTLALEAFNAVSCYIGIHRGIIPDRTAHKRLPIGRYISTVLTAVLVVLLIFYFASRPRGITVSISDFTDTRHIPTVSELIPDEKLKPDKFIMDGVNYASFITTRKDLIAPVMQEQKDSMLRENDDTVRVEGTYIEFISSDLARIAADELMQDALGETHPVEMCDYAIYASNGVVETLTVQKGSRVLKLKCIGKICLLSAAETVEAIAFPD